MKRRPGSHPTSRKVGVFLIWSLLFLSYSFLGFLLEVAFAFVTRSRPERKCLLLIPLCPVYGLGTCSILLLPDPILRNPALLFLFGGVVATLAEYLTAWFYERILGVSFWDYHDLPWNIHGRVCLPFTLAWGALSLLLVYWLQPQLLPLLQQIPTPVAWSALIAAAVDFLFSCILLKQSGTITCLAWYRA